MDFLYQEVSVKNDINVDESLLKVVQHAYKYKNVNKGFKSSDLNYVALKPKSNTIKDRENCLLYLLILVKTCCYYRKRPISII